MDLTFYYWHRLNHTLPWLWRFHCVHHIDPDLDVTTSFRSGITVGVGRFHRPENNRLGHLLLLPFRRRGKIFSAPPGGWKTRAAIPGERDIHVLAE